MTENFWQPPTFQPSLEEFSNLTKFLEKVQDQCVPFGICKIVAPAEWRKNANFNYEQVDNFLIPSPIRQYASGDKGAFQLMLVEEKPMTVKKFKHIASKSKVPRSSKYQYDSIDRLFWKNLRYDPPMYGADMVGSLFPEHVENWNPRQLNTILNVLGNHLPGINVPYLYFGMWKAMFAWHVEDMNLFSINYLHFGEPKHWYAIPAEYGPRFERLAQGYFPQLHKECPEFLRHKTSLISPNVVLQNDIPITRVVQKEGEFIVTFPYAYHAGFNEGFNCAESVNFALESWIPYGKQAKSCLCSSDTVRINMDTFVQAYEDYKANPWDFAVSLDHIKQLMDQHVQGSSMTPVRTTKSTSISSRRKSDEHQTIEHEEAPKKRSKTSHEPEEQLCRRKRTPNKSFLDSFTDLDALVDEVDKPPFSCNSDEEIDIEEDTPVLVIKPAPVLSSPVKQELVTSLPPPLPTPITQPSPLLSQVVTPAPVVLSTPVSPSKPPIGISAPVFQPPGSPLKVGVPAVNTAVPAAPDTNSPRKDRKSPKRITKDIEKILEQNYEVHKGIPDLATRKKLADQVSWTPEGLYGWFRRRYRRSHPEAEATAAAPSLKTSLFPGLTSLITNSIPWFLRPGSNTSNTTPTTEPSIT